MAYAPPKVWTSTPTQITVQAGGLPSWVPGPGQYTIASPSTPAAQVTMYPPNNATWGGSQGSDALFNTWNGAAFVPTVGTLGSMFYWGGGHYGYFGDDIMRFDIETRTWSRWLAVSPWALTIANPPGVPDDSGHVRGTLEGGWTAGTAAGYIGPAPVHTYSLLQHLTSQYGGASGLGSFMVIVNESTGVKIEPYVYLLDLNTKVWTRPFKLLLNVNGLNALHGSTCLDPKRNVVWYGGGEEEYLHRVNINGGVDSLARSAATMDTYVSPSASEALLNYLPDLDILFAWAQGTTIPVYWGIDLSTTPTATSGFTGIKRYQISISNPTADPFYRSGLLTGGSGGWYEMGPNGYLTCVRGFQDKVYMWELRHPKPPADWKTTQWTWNLEIVSAKLPTDDPAITVPAQTNSLYSKMRYVPSIKSIVYGPYRSTTKAVACRRSDWL